VAETKVVHDWYNFCNFIYFSCNIQTQTHGIATTLSTVTRFHNSKLKMNTAIFYIHDYNESLVSPVHKVNTM